MRHLLAGHIRQLQKAVYLSLHAIAVPQPPVGGGGGLVILTSRSDAPAKKNVIIMTGQDRVSLHVVAPLRAEWVTLQRRHRVHT